MQLTSNRPYKFRSATCPYTIRFEPVIITCRKMLKIKVLFRRPFGIVMAFLCATSGAFGAPLKVLNGQVPDVVPGLKAKGDLAGTNELRMAIGLPLRNTETLK